jgi:hypothetical protein
MRPDLVSFKDGLAAYRLDGEVVRIPGLTREGAEHVLALRKRGDRLYVTLAYATDETPAIRFRRGGLVMIRRSSQTSEV